jgi:hypothetical protein
MDPFSGFTFVELDASDSRKVRIIRKGPHRERVDLIARQFQDALIARDPADTAPHGMVLTGDFKISGRVTSNAGWMSFFVDKGDGKDEELKEVAAVYFAREDNPAAREVLGRVEQYIHAGELPAPPLVVAVKLTPAVPVIIRDWYAKSVAAFFAE